MFPIRTIPPINEKRNILPFLWKSSKPVILTKSIPRFQQLVPSFVQAEHKILFFRFHTSHEVVKFRIQCRENHTPNEKPPKALPTGKVPLTGFGYREG